MSPTPQLTHSLNRRLWILGQDSVSFWGSAPSCSSNLLSATGTEDTDSFVSPGVSEKEVTAGPLQGSVHRWRGLGQEMRQRRQSTQTQWLASLPPIGVAPKTLGSLCGRGL